MFVATVKIIFIREILDLMQIQICTKYWLVKTLNSRQLYQSVIKINRIKVLILIYLSINNIVIKIMFGFMKMFPN